LAGFNQIEILQFFASLVRVSCLFVLLPVFGDKTVPPLVRIFLAFTVNLIVFPIAAATSTGQVATMSVSEAGLAFIVFKEAMVGFLLGFTAKLFFDGLAFAFGYMGIQMGFSMASAYDTQAETSEPVISRLVMLLAILLFLGINGHYIFFKALVQSYHVVPLGSFVFTKKIAAYVLETSGQVFWIAIKLSAPMALVIFMINCAFGIIARAVPQINVLIVSFTVNILAGFLVVALTLPVFGTSVGEVFHMMMDRLVGLIGVLA
jgi:flagellar biosynthetic protein FliR